VLTADQLANLDAAQRQEARSYPRLPEHARCIEALRSEKLRRKQVVFAYGNFLASLIVDGWWVTITIRDRNQRFSVRGKRTLRGKIRRRYADCSIRYGHQDGKIKSWRPASKINRPWGPFTHKILAEVRLFMELVEKSAGVSVGYIIAEEIGELNGRWHLHLLVSGVSHLYRKVWWSAALQLWGRSRIDLYDPQKAAAFYAAKYAAKQLGSIELCGTLRGRSMEAIEQPKTVAVGRRDVARSDEMSSDFFHSPAGSFRGPKFSGTLPARVWRQRGRQKWIRFEDR
jgi:hypothetical protein